MKEILLAGIFASLFSFFGTPLLIRILANAGYGQMIRDDGPKSHHSKRGTPTMGGLMILSGILVATLLWADLDNLYVWAVLFVTLGFGAIGFYDDYLKVTRSSTRGFSGRVRLAAEFAIAGIAVACFIWIGEKSLSSSLALPFFKDVLIPFGIAFILVGVLVVVGSGNAVNLTDGLDGLATGAAVMSFGAFILIGVWEFGQSCAISAGAKCYEVRDPLDLAVLAAALSGSCFAFLWWNASPAKIFMGDTGSLALGGALAGLAITTRTQLLLLLLGGLFAVITLSVILQVSYFKISRGKRIFRMAPLQHHFELMGWGEVTIVIRFWIIAGISRNANSCRNRIEIRRA